MMKQLFISLIALTVGLGCSKASIPTSSLAQPATPTKVLRTVRVATTMQLKNALLNALPGDDIVMADGYYKGKFVIAPDKNGTPTLPITLRGTRNAILDAENIQTGYVLHLQSSYWLLKGFTLTNGLKGLMVDGSNHSIIDGIKVQQIGEEAIHLRKFSSHNTIQHCEVSNIGLKNPSYGEGIYIGSAKNNWARYSEGSPDLSDSNLVLNNKIGPGITAECIDIKEGTTGGIIRGNHFDATGITGANGGDSWIDVKGNGYLIENNTGFNEGGSIFKDGYQTHVAYEGWGNQNIFKNNQSTVNASGYGFYIQLSGSNGTSVGNKVYQNNTVTGAQKGTSNIPLSN